MTVPIDITDPRVVKAYAHPLRVHILGLLDNRVASPSEIAGELDSPLSNTSYHVRQLVSLGLVELVGRSVKRGAIEHHYTARVRPTITDDGWAQLPRIVKRAVLGGGLQQGVTHAVQAAKQGGFDRDDVHYSRTAGPLDAKGWKAVSRELSKTLKRIEDLVDESKSRLAASAEAHAESEAATIIMMHFAGPTPGTIRSRRPSRADEMSAKSYVLAARAAHVESI